MEQATLQQVIEFARKAHERQFRRDGVTPYFNHIEEVLKRVGYDKETAEKQQFIERKVYMVAILHDTLEQGTETIDLIKLSLPEDVFDAVKTLTKDKFDDYLEYINLVKYDQLARQVKIADILSNLADNPTEKQIIKYAKALLILHDAE